MRRYATTGRLQAIGLVFLCVVVAVVVYTHQLIIPLFLGMLTWGKAWIKSLTPKLGLLLVKNGVAIQSRKIVMQASTHFLVKSHKPWRRFLITTRLKALAVLKQGFQRYLQLPLWLRTGLAIGLLLTTAGSTFAAFALLIIPQPVLNWLRQRVTITLNKLGVNKFFSAVWNLMVPAALRHRWYMHIKWTVGRRQVHAAKHLHSKVSRNDESR